MKKRKSRVLQPLAVIGHNMFLFRKHDCAERSMFQGGENARRKPDLAPHIAEHGGGQPGSPERIAYLAKWYADPNNAGYTPFKDVWGHLKEDIDGE